MLGTLQKDGDDYRGACGVQVLHDGGMLERRLPWRLTSSGCVRVDSFLGVGACEPMKSPWAGGWQMGAASHLGSGPN